MRLVAADASHRPVKVLVAVGGLVASAARLRGLRTVPRRGVWVVTADAAARTLELGVIRVHALVAVDAGALSAAAHVVRRVAASTSSVCWHRRCRQRVNLGVTRAARQRLLLGEVVRLVTAHALSMAISKQRGLGDARLLGRVAALAAGKRVARGSMLVLMACGADLLWRFALSCVLRLNVAVAAGARARLRCRVPMDLMAADTGRAPVHDHRRRSALR